MKKLIVLALAFLVALLIVAPGNRDSVEAVVISSSNVALVPGPCGAFSGAGCMPTSGFSGGYAPSFTNVATSNLPNVISNYDTVVLLQICNIGSWLGDSTWRDALDSWIQAGGKLIIYDSDACGTLTLDYSNFVFPFSTNNPCQCGSNLGTLEIVEDNTLSSTDPTSPYYIDVAPIEQNTDAVGDASVMLTQDSHWKGDMKAKNTLGFEGFTHTYGEYGSGLIIYNGLDSDNIGSSSGLQKIWELELKQQWDPSDLPGGVPVAGIAFSDFQPADGEHIKQEADAQSIISASGWIRRFSGNRGASTPDTGWLQQQLLRNGVRPVIHSVDFESTGEIDWTSIKVYLNGTDVTDATLICRFGPSNGSLEVAHYWFDGTVTVKVEVGTVDGGESSAEWEFTAETAILYPTFGWGALKYWLNRWWLPVTDFLSVLYNPEPLSSC